MNEQEKNRILEERAKQMFDNFDEYNEGIETEIKNILEEFLPDTHENTIDKMFDAILTIVENHTDYIKGE